MNPVTTTNNTIQASDSDSVQNELRELIPIDNGVASESLALSGEFLQMLLMHLAIPVLVSMIGSSLYEILKGRDLAALTRRDAEELLESFKGQKKAISTSIDKECIEAMMQLLEPYGIDQSTAEAAYEKIKIKILKDN